jgi:hypothetical protein
MTACCLLLKITLVLAPGTVIVAAVVAEGISETSAHPDQRWTAFLSALTTPLFWVSVGFIAVVGATVGWIAVFDDPVQGYRQTIQWPIEYRGSPALSLSSFVNAFGLLERCSLQFVFAGCIPGLIYGWFTGLRRQAFLAAMLLGAEFLRISIESAASPYLTIPIVVPMLIGSSLFGSSRQKSAASMLAWMVPLYLLAPLLIPTIRDQAKTFELRAVKQLPAPYEYLAEQMRARYQPGERIFVNEIDEQILLLLNAPRPFPILFVHFRNVSKEEQERTLKHYKAQPPDWIISSDPNHSPVKFATLGSVDESYDVYLPSTASRKPIDTRARAGSSIGTEEHRVQSADFVGAMSKQYILEVDTGYLQAWHLVKNGGG